MKSIIKDTLALTAITLIAGLLLGFVYEITKAPIAASEEKAKQESYQEVFIEAKEFKEVEYEAEKLEEALISQGLTAQSVDAILTAENEAGETLGYVLQITSHEGYGGDITFTMGISTDKTLNGISILSIGETAGLGMKANTEEFKSQFANKQVEQFTYTKKGATAEDEIDALSGATITTNAMTNGVNAGLCAFDYIKGGNES